MIRLLGFLMLFALVHPALQAQSILKDATVYDRRVVLVSNDKLELAVATQGGSIIRLSLQGDPKKISPFGNPELVPSVPDNKKFQGPMIGHFVCVDGFGPASPEERAAGMPMHGEAYLQPWEVVSLTKEGATTTVKFRAQLPRVQETFVRTLQMVDGENVVYADSELDRQVAWGEHPACPKYSCEVLAVMPDGRARLFC
jgi:D-hexose-6-phosphate mutarotase